jgi:hypothetical protein
MLRTILTAAVLFGFTLSALAEDKVTFSPKKEAGTFVTITKVKSDQQISGPQEAKITTDMTMTLETVVEKATDEGQKIHVTYKRVQMKASGGPQAREMSYDSAAEDEEGSNPMAAAFKQILGKKIDVTLDNKGAVTKVEGAGMVEKSVKEMFTQNLPDKPIAVGEHWENTMKQDMPGGKPLNVKLTSTLRKVDNVGGHKVAVIDIEGKGTKEAATSKNSEEGEAPAPGKMVMDMKGTIKLDLVTGQSVESEVTVNADMDMGVMTIKSKSVINTATKEGKYEAPKKVEKPAKPDDQPKPVE